MRVALLLLACAAGALAGSRVELEPYTGVPAGWSHVSRAKPDSRIALSLAVKQTNLDMLKSTLLRVSDPDDAENYGRHLSKAQVDALVAPRAEHVDTVRDWLPRTASLQSTANFDLVTATMSIAEAESLLSVEYHVYEHAETGLRATRCNRRYTVPSQIADALDFVAPASRFPNPHRSVPKVVAHASSERGGSAGGVSPSFLRTLYSVPDSARAANGTANIVACASFLDQFFAPKDLSAFFSEFDTSLAGESPKVVGPNTATRPGVEAMLDIEYIMAMGRGVPAQFWSTAGEQPHNPENEPFLVWLQNVASTQDAEVPKTFSVSYGDNEPGVNLAYAQRVGTEFQKAGLRGLSILFSSGDGGVSGGQSQQCTRFVPTFPAGSPWVTAVGGTTSQKPEVCASFSSGGFSDYWARPDYQADAVKSYFATAGSKPGFPDASRYNATGAGIPDVAAQGENVEIVIDGRTSGVAGTSCSSPIFSGIVSLLNEQRIKAGKSTLGFLNPLLYKNADAFNDITSGSNPGCGTKGFPAAKGWDPVTGLGTPDFGKLSKIVAALP